MPVRLLPETPPSAGAPDQWAIGASTLPLAFAQVREDPRLDLEVVERLPRGATVVMIASGGETAVELARRPLERLHLVDMNPAQLALTRLKFHLARTGSPTEAAAILGHRPMAPAARLAALGRELEILDVETAGLGPPDLLATAGPDQAGRYEVTFSQLRRELAPVESELNALLDSTDTAAAARSVARGSRLGDALDAAFERVMSLSNLVALFGAEATQNPRQPFARHFAERTRVAFSRFPAFDNPFLWQIFAGSFPDRQPYDWLHPAARGRPLVEPVCHRGRMRDVLDSLPAGTADFVHLSNILDWITPMEAAGTLQSVQRALKPGGYVLLRQLNSTLDPTTLDSGIAWGREWGIRMEQRDRSFFYPALHVGRTR